MTQLTGIQFLLSGNRRSRTIAVLVRGGSLRVPVKQQGHPPKSHDETHFTHGHAGAGTGAYCTSVTEAADRPAKKPSGIDQIENVVVIYAENRSFDNLYGFFPDANGLQHLSGKIAPQRDRDGLVLKELPPIWDGLAAKGVTPTVTEGQTQHLANRPFAIDDPNGFNLSLDVATRDLLNLFYQNQMQINRGKNDKFVAYGNSGALVMGHYKNGDKLPLWQIARQYTLADNFFMGAFGGSFLNHFWLVCACTPKYPNADQSPAKGQIAILEDDGLSSKLGEDSPKSAM